MPFDWLAAGIAASALAANAISARRQRKENRKFAEYQNLVNSQMLDKQLDYDSPKSQMLRFQEAGLNPNLIYGSGTASAGNQGSPQTSADFKPPDYQQVTSPLGPLLNQSLMTQSQVQAIDAKTRDTYVVTRLHALQAQVLARNPSLQETGFKAIMDSLISSAEIKASESKIIGQKSRMLHTQDIKTGLQYGEQMFLTQLDILDQKYKLGGLDAKIKAEIINSKEFQNDLLEVQKKWMTEAEITPQHIYTFVQMLLMKLLN